jgi:hypothetical protein
MNARNWGELRETMLKSLADYGLGIAGMPVIVSESLTMQLAQARVHHRMQAGLLRPHKAAPGHR